MIEGDPKSETLVALVALLYERKDCECGGPLHVVLDDGNFYEEALSVSRAALAEWPLEVRVLGDAILRLLESYPEDERVMAEQSWVEQKVLG